MNRTVFERHKDMMTEKPPGNSLPLTACLLLAGIFSAAVANAQGNETSPFIDSIAVGSAWQNVTANEGNNLRIDYQTVAYSGGGTKNGRTVVFGGGHNNGLNDAVAFLDWRNFETVGWTEELVSTADHIGVADNDWGQIGQYLNANYNGATPGGISDDRGLVALSRHTYDQIVVRSDHFYIFSGILPYDNPGQPNEPWDHVEGDIWRYDFGSGWSFIGAPLANQYGGHAAAAEDTLTGNIWVHDGAGLRLFNTTSETVSSPIASLSSQAEESSLNFNPDKGAQGTLFGSGRFAGSSWHEYDIATGQQRNMGAVPGNAESTYIIYVDASFGSNYGTYFAIVPQNGTLRRWNGSGWDTVATGGPTGNGHVYGRAGFEPVHQVFYWIHNSYSGNNAWQTRVVRPYPFNGSAEPPPTVALSADPESVPAQGTTTLTWSSTNANSCNASGDWSGAKPLSGSAFFGPLNSDKTYSLACSGSGGTSSDTVTVTIQGTQPAPTVSISANPSSVDAGGFAVVDWTSSNASSCSAFGDWSGNKPLQGSESVGPLSQDSTFRMTCSGTGGDATNAATITVNTPAPPPPPPPPVDDNPTTDPQNQIGGGSFGLLFLLMLATLGLFRQTVIDRRR
ncbi:MAG TPA: GlyGly-CTERM sorting domain-containing protein [Woeseiaceae bacterium]|nr:GlyGly-CTERM sorting domain-containing protein [Woeseiaceae bacterium]